MAVAVPVLGPFISLFGALCLSLLAIVIPAVLDIAVRYGAAAPDGSTLGYKNYGSLKYQLLRSILIIVLGLVALVFGVYTSLLEIFEKFGQHSEFVQEYNLLGED